MKTDQSKWLPIESAPRDGTPILLGFNDEDFGEFVGQGRWHEEDHDGPDNMGHDAGFMDDQFDAFKCARSFGAETYRSAGFQPTHWMPLPPPPGEDAPKQPVSVEVSEDEIEAIAHRKAWRYKHSSDPHHSSTYTFNRTCLMDFARAILALAGGERKEASKPDPVAVMTTQGLKFYSAEVAKSLHVGTQFYTEPVKEASKPVADEPLRAALLKAREFIVNGTALGFIRMPDADCPDSAHQTLPMIEAALSSHHPSNAQPSAEQPTCHWHPDGTGDWTTGCGLTHTMHGTPWKKGMHFCCGCGKHLMEHTG